MRFHHIGVACHNIQEEIESISQIHDVIDVSPTVFDPEQNAELCIIKTSDGVVIELISGEQVANLLKKRITYYHLCFETGDIIAEIRRLQEGGAVVVSEPKPAILFGYKQVAFLLVSYGLIELVQSN